jgi:DoxX-like protein
MSRALWIVQVLLAFVFCFGGAFKLLAPADVLAQQMPLPELFVRFIGACETLGAIGLILPGLLRIRPGLTPLAAAGLVIIMTGATILTPSLVGELAPALLPLVLGILAAFVVYGRTQVAPISTRSTRPAALASAS